MTLIWLRRPEVDVALWVRDLDAFLPKQAPSIVQDLALHVMDAMLRIGDPKAYLQFDRGFTEGHDKDIRCRRGQNAMRSARRLTHQCNDLVQIGIVWHAYRDLQADTLVVVRPV